DGLGEPERLLERVEAGPRPLGAVAGDARPHLVVVRLRGGDEEPPRAERRRARQREPALARAGAAPHEDEARRHRASASRPRFGTTTTTGTRVARMRRSLSYPKNSWCWMARFSAPSTTRS